MKKILTFGISLMFLFSTCFFVHAEPQMIILAIESTVEASATGTFTVKSSPHAPDIDQNTISDLANKDGDFVFQITAMTAPAGSDHSGTFDIYYKQSLVDSDWEWARAPANYIISDMAISGNTTYEVHFYPEYTKNMRFYCVEKSGTTEVSTINARLQTK